MADKEKKIDPYDVEALEKSLNDSATRVSTIWVSFLIFSLYLLTAATTVTHRQLFLAEPVKLPVLNIDLPLWGFFFLAPILFVILHAYVLLQVILLARTAGAYEIAVNRVVEQGALRPEEESALRQRLANTLFAQIFAGTSRERTGWFGMLLRGMAWITLAIAPILILLTFQFTFLPYHSNLATWTHRLLILAELASVFWIWPLALDATRDLEIPNIRTSATSAYALLRRLSRRDYGWNSLWFRQRILPLMACLFFVVVPLSIGTFPGEPHLNVLTGSWPFSVNCTRWFAGGFDRLDLSRLDVVDDKKLADIQATGVLKDRVPHQTERTRDFSRRNLRCADLEGTDLRHADFAEAKLAGAKFADAELQGSNFTAAELDQANFSSAKMQGASLARATLRNAYLSSADLQGATLGFAKLQGADMEGAKLQGAFLGFAELQGVSLTEAELQGASFDHAYAQAVAFHAANLRGASVRESRLHGASFLDAHMEGATFARSQLQGSSFAQTSLKMTDLSDTLLWRATAEDCSGAKVAGAKHTAIIDKTLDAEFSETVEVPANSQTIGTFIQETAASQSGFWQQQRVANRMRQRLLDTAVTAAEQQWQRCAGEVFQQAQFEAARLQTLIDLVCKDAIGEGTIIRSLIRSHIRKEEATLSLAFANRLRGVLAVGADLKSCPGVAALSQAEKASLLRATNANASLLENRDAPAQRLPLRLIGC